MQAGGKPEADVSTTGSVDTSTGDVGRLDIGSRGVVSFTGHGNMMQCVNVLDVVPKVEGVGAGRVSLQAHQRLIFNVVSGIEAYPTGLGLFGCVGAGRHDV